MQLERPFKRSENDDDWLGNGIYFWEYAPQQAWNWARRRYRGEDIAVLGCMLRLGNCFDLLDPENARRLQRYHGRFLRELSAAGKTPPRNVRARKRLDCAIFEYANAIFAAEEAEELDSVRAVYVPTSGKQRLWPQSWLYHETHVHFVHPEPAVYPRYMAHKAKRSMKTQRQAESGSPPRPMGLRLEDALRRARLHSPQRRAEILARAGLIREDEIAEVAARLAAHRRGATSR